MDRTIDHVAFGGTELYELQAAANEVGLTPTYGGEHGTGMTHMAVTPFPDGSYPELIAPALGADATGVGFWPDCLAADIGPVAWCLGTDDVASVKTAIDAGLPVDDPHEASRVRPDGRLVEWGMCSGGSDQRLPFLIHDRTPRGYRVPEAVLNASFRGFQTVVVATRDHEATVALFARRHRYSSPVDINGPFPEFAALLGMPLALCEPGDGTLDACINEVGKGPRMSLTGVTDPGCACTMLSLGPEIRYGDRRMVWFDHDLFDGRLGSVELS